MFGARPEYEEPNVHFSSLVFSLKEYRRVTITRFDLEFGFGPTGGKLKKRPFGERIKPRLEEKVRVVGEGLLWWDKGGTTKKPTKVSYGGVRTTTGRRTLCDEGREGKLKPSR